MESFTKCQNRLQSVFPQKGQMNGWLHWLNLSCRSLSNSSTSGTFSSCFGFSASIIFAFLRSQFLSNGLLVSGGANELLQTFTNFCRLRSPSLPALVGKSSLSPFYFYLISIFDFSPLFVAHRREVTGEASGSYQTLPTLLSRRPVHPLCWNFTWPT